MRAFSKWQAVPDYPIGLRERSEEETIYDSGSIFSASMAGRQRGNWHLDCRLHLEAPAGAWFEGPWPERPDALDLFAVGLRQLADECEGEAKRLREKGRTTSGEGAKK